MDSSLVWSGIVTAGAGAIIMGVRYFIRDALVKVYCRCGHEYNDHYVVPRGMENPVGGELCKVCKCQAYNPNPKDPKNTPPFRFF